jgi:molybdate transport system substrate-binding protein
MRRNFIAAILVAAFLTGFVEVARADEILVAAAASLTDGLNEIGAVYRSKSKNSVNFTFGPSSTLARQIEEGAPADLFLH